MSKNVDQSDLYKTIGIPPNRAVMKVSGPLETIEGVNSKFFQMGLTAADLKPIDWRKKVRLSPVMNQQDCGDCWAMSSTSALADRFIIKKNIENLMLNPAITAQCAPTQITEMGKVINQGCNGGQPMLAGQFFQTTGVCAVEQNCQEWKKLCPEKGNCKLKSCNTLSSVCKNATRYFALPNSTKNLIVTSKDNEVDINATIANIKAELVNGPVVASFFVPVDFMASGLGYKWEKTNGIFINGAYNDELDKLMPAKVKEKFGITDKRQWADIYMENGSPAGHAVSIVGWDKGDAGKYGRVFYWIVRNSWGTKWNEGGFFRIAMNDGQGHNDKLALDVPVSSLIIASTGQSTPIGQLFGGCVCFQPDLSTGQPRGYHYPGPTSHKNKVNIVVIIIIVAVLLLLGLGGYYYFLKKSKKR